MGLERSVKGGESRVEIKIQEQVEEEKCRGVAIDIYTDYNNPPASAGSSSQTIQKYSHLYWTTIFD